MFSKLCYSLCDDEDHCPLNPKSPVKKKDSKEETVSRIDDRARSYKGDVIYGDVSHQEKDQRGYYGKGKGKMYGEQDTKWVQVPERGSRSYSSYRSSNKGDEGSARHRSSRWEQSRNQTQEERDRMHRDSRRERNYFGLLGFYFIFMDLYWRCIISFLELWIMEGDRHEFCVLVFWIIRFLLRLVLKQILDLASSNQVQCQFGTWVYWFANRCSGIMSIASIFYGFVWVRVGLLFGCCGFGLFELWNKIYCFEYGIWYLRLQSVNLIFWIMMNCAFVDGQSRVLGCYDWINGYIWFMGFWFMLKTYRTVSQLSLLQLVSLNQLQIRELELRKAFWTVQVLLWDGSGLRYIMTILSTLRMFLVVISGGRRRFGIVHKRFSHGVCLFQGTISVWCYFILTMASKKSSTILALHGYGQIMFILILLMSGKGGCSYSVNVAMVQRSERFCKDSTATKDLPSNGNNKGIIMVLQNLLVLTDWFFLFFLLFWRRGLQGIIKPKLASSWELFIYIFLI